jgi:hypothetical protein
MTFMHMNGSVSLSIGPSGFEERRKLLNREEICFSVPRAHETGRESIEINWPLPLIFETSNRICNQHWTQIKDAMAPIPAFGFGTNASIE